MTGTGLVVSGGGGDGYTKGEVDAKLADYLPILNDYGLGITPHVLTSGSIAENVDGSGFFSYEAGSDLDEQGQPIVTKVSDRPTGSEKGRLIVLSNSPVFDDQGNVTTPAVQDVIGLPEDIEGVFYRRGTGPWIKFTTASDLADYIKTNSTGLIETPIVMKNNVAIRAEVTPDGGWKDILNITPNGAMEVGSGSARLFLYSSEDPYVEIDGTDYKLYTEHFPPPSSGGGGSGVGNVLKVSRVVASGQFTLQPTTKKVLVHLIGAGGGGAPIPSGSLTTNTIASGGGAGGYVEIFADLTDSLAAGSTLQFTIGAPGINGGQGGQSQMAMKSSDGQSTYIYATCNGGGGGNLMQVPTDAEYSRVVGGTGGTASVGPYSGITAIVNRPGEPGEFAWALHTDLLEGAGELT